MSVYVTNSNLTIIEYQDLFGRYGKLIGIDTMNGYCRLTFADFRDAKDAIKDLDGYKVGNRRLHVDNKPPNGQPNN